MKVLRVTMLTALLLVGATPRTVPTAKYNAVDESQTITLLAAGDCYFINGVWVCDP